jgi:hypothetical protein
MNTNEMFGNNVNDEVAGLPPIRMEPALIDMPPKPRVQPNEGEAVFAEDRVKIVLADNDDMPPTGLFIGLNGVGYLLKPNLPAVVPLGLVGILDTAVAAAPIVDPLTQQITGFRDRLRFPYRVIVHIPAGTPVVLEHKAAA